MEIKAALYMIPVEISEAPVSEVLPPANIEVMKNIRHYIVENVRTARRFLKKCDRSIDIGEITFYELNRHTNLADVAGFLAPLRKGEPVGVMSEAGCPGIADPGAVVVEVAMREGLRVIPLVGPSSILMALMASGFNGQGFSFNGYLPIEASERDKKVRDLEALSRRSGMTQIFIETPYRNGKMMECLLKSLRPDTLLCVACEITDRENEKIISLPVSKWKGRSYDFDKKPAIFLIHASKG